MCTRKGTEGSNPSLSAKIPLDRVSADDFSVPLSRMRDRLRDSARDEGRPGVLLHDRVAPWRRVRRGYSRPPRGLRDRRGGPSARDNRDGRVIRELARLRRIYGPGRWRKRKGIARIRLDDGTLRTAEIHGYAAHGIGRKELKIKRFLA